MKEGENPLIVNLDYVDSKRDYWFVRTDGGDNYETFLEYGFIGIGWNHITLDDLTNKSPYEVQTKIAKSKLPVPYDLETSRGKGKATSDYNKLVRFKNLKKGDVVIIPSYSSVRLSFGIIEDDKVYIVNEKTGECDYHKRRKVNWVTTKRIDSLDPKFYEIKVTRHSISDVKPYESYIDRVMSTFYFKENTGNFVFHINQEENINLFELIDLISSLKELMLSINEEFDFDENIRDSSIKLSLQSKGTFALIAPVGKSLATLGLILALHSCGRNIPNDTPPEMTAKTEQYIEKHKKKLDKVTKTADSLQVDMKLIEDTFLKDQ